MAAGGPLRLADRFAWGRRTYVMAVINLTPDSFSRDGLLDRPDALAAALARGRALVADGAHILDVGGESTRPGAEPVPAAEELRRVVPAIAALAGETEAVISIDTSKAEVAAAALDAGAAMVNDTCPGLSLGPALLGSRCHPRLARVREPGVARCWDR